MFKRIKATNYRLLKSVDQELANFNILIGANASGKSTFFDVLSFISDFANRGAQYAIQERIESSFEELTHQKKGGPVSFVIDIELPESLSERGDYNFTRYDVEFLDNAVNHEVLSLHNADGAQRTLAERVFLNDSFRRGWHARLTSEEDVKGRNDWKELLVKMDDDASLLGITIDVAKQPAVAHSRKCLVNDIQPILLNTSRVSQPVHPKQQTGNRLSKDGSNFAWVMKQLWGNQLQSENFNDWVMHVRTVLRNLEKIQPSEFGDRSLGFEAQFDGFADDQFLPAKSLSDGTLRLLALTILAYLPNDSQTYLIEEPENGIHPRGIQAIYQSLSSIYDGQVFLATHSPVFLSLAKPSELLCFSKSNLGATEIINGDKHPNLQSWSGEVDMSELFASGVLG